MSKATKPATTITVDLNQLRTLLMTVLPFTGGDIGLPVLASVKLEVRGDRLLAIATDRYTLGVSKINVEDADGFEALVKAKDVRHILNTFKNRKAIQSKVALTVSEGSITVSLVDGLFADAEDLTARYGLMDGTFPKVLEIFRQWKPADSGVIGCNPAYLARFQHVTSMRGEPVRMSVGSGTSPVIVQAGDYFLGAIMPVRFDKATGPVELSAWVEGEPEAVAEAS
jgi:DNA polymerase III sliding clamp (beta) subunit (PCNA family)